MKSGAAQKYETMTLEEIESMPIAEELAEKDSALFLWATVPLLPEALRVMKAWGFNYKTVLFWDKKRFGTGYWYRGQVEMLLFGTRGKVKAFRVPERNLFSDKSTVHSRKPAYYRELIERSWPDVRRIELFARRAPDEAWDVWGNEAEGRIE